MKDFYGVFNLLGNLEFLSKMKIFFQVFYSCYVCYLLGFTPWLGVNLESSLKGTDAYSYIMLAIAVGITKVICRCPCQNSLRIILAAKNTLPCKILNFYPMTPLCLTNVNVIIISNQVELMWKETLYLFRL